MALKPFQLKISFIFHVFLLLPPITHAKRNTPNYTNPSSPPLDYKAYLKRYGYLDYHINKADHYYTTNNNDDSEQDQRILESAIKTFQENFHIKPTGMLDAETISAMRAPRCGVPDIINGTNHMQLTRNSSNPLTASHFAVPFRSPKWTRFQLTYRLLQGFPDAAGLPLEYAFNDWASVTSNFSFSRYQGLYGGDIVVGFYRGAHGDGRPFDGPGGLLAHATAPMDGKLHFDADEAWSYDHDENPSPYDYDAFDFKTVALHEIGHLLGLEHSTVSSAVMFPSIGLGEVKILDADDINGIKYLYGTVD